MCDLCARSAARCSQFVMLFFDVGLQCVLELFSLTARVSLAMAQLGKEDMSGKAVSCNVNGPSS